MLSVTAVVSTYCFVETSGGLAQVVWLDLESPDDDEVEVWVEGSGVTCPVRWRGQLSGGAKERAEVAILVPDGARSGDMLPIEAVARSAGAAEAREAAWHQVREPGWTMFMVSHFHYDPVWWNTQAAYTSGWDDLVWAQDRRDTFQHTGLVLVESHLERARLDPDYKFVLAEVDYLKPYWDLYPDRRGELRRLLAEGRLEIVGGTYNEPNTNLTAFETAVRCGVYGVGFQRDIFGASPESAWQLDVFAHDPSFPGLMASCGVTSSAWARGPFHQWGPKQHTGSTSWMQFPSEFEWLSPDGTGLLTSYMPDHYSAGWQLDLATTLEEAMQRAYDLFCDLAAVSATKATLLPVGTDYTPPNKWVTQLARAWSGRYAWPRFVPGLPKEFFAAVRAELAEQGRPPSPQTREMGPIYTGKDVSFIDTKQANRWAETVLLEAEKLSSFALALGHPYAERAADKAWRQLVFNAHHDGITGSESDQVYLDLLGGWREAYELAAGMRTSAAAAIASHIDIGPGAGPGLVVFNSLSRARGETASVVVTLPERGARSVVVRDGDGQQVPCLTTPLAHHPDGTVLEARVEFLTDGVPALGYRCYRVDRSGQEPGRWVPVEGLVASNERFAVEADPARGGCLNRWVDRRSGRELLVEGDVGNELLVYPEYPTHPEMMEGPWHLMPVGPPVRSSHGPARVEAQRSALGERLVVEGQLDGMSCVQVVTLLSGSSRVQVRTYLNGFSGVDRLVRLRFPVAVRGGTPLAEVGNAVVARGVGFVDADSAVAPWTLDTPVQGWAGVGSTLCVELGENGRAYGSRALGVAEVVTPSGAGAELLPEIRALVVALAAKGVTASCTEATSNRYGGLRGDSNLPDVRISIGRAEDNALTAAVLASAGADFQAELDRQLAQSSRARVWVPAGRPSDEVWVPNADVRGARDLPVLVLVGSDAASIEKEVASLVGEVQSERIVVSQPASLSTPSSPGAGDKGPWIAADRTVAILNRGTPGFAVDTAGAIYVSLLRSCTGWPSGVWIDPPRRTAPDGSNFELEHWDHVYEHTLVAGDGDWRATGCPWEAQAFNTPLVAVVEPPHGGDLPAAGSFLEVTDPARQMVLAVLKPAGNPMAGGRLPDRGGAVGTGAVGAGALGAGAVGAGEAGGARWASQPAEAVSRGEADQGQGAPASDTVELTARLYESAGRGATATLSGGLSWTVEQAWSTNLLEEAGEPIECSEGTLTLTFSPAETRTVRLLLRRAAGNGVDAPDAGATTAPAAAAGLSTVTPARVPVPVVGPGGASGAGGALGLEPAQPTFSRYWLHNKGPAPMGNQLLAVHLAPTSLRVRKEAGASLVATISSGAVAAEQAGNLEVVVPAGWSAEPPSRLFNVAPGAYASVTFRLTPAPKARPGRYFVAARALDGGGQAQEDVATIDLLPVDPLGPYRRGDESAGSLSGQGSQASLGIQARPGSQASFDHPSTQIGAELEASLSRNSLTIAAGSSDVLAAVLANRTSGEIRGEAQLVSPFETWPFAGPWTEGFIVAPGGRTEVPFTVAAPADATALTSWLLVKVMYFGRLWYSPAVRLEIAPGQPVANAR